MQPDVQARIEEIEKLVPGKVESVKLHEQGWQFLVIEVNQEWMFRFSRSDDCRSLRAETSFLKRFSALSPLPVPRPKFEGTDFSGYRKIDGRPLSQGIVRDLEREVRRRVAHQISAFLSSLHSFPLEEAYEIGMTRGWDGWPEKAYKVIRETVVPLLSTQTRSSALDLLAWRMALERPNVVVHGDLCPEHLLFDDRGQKLCGVIDFGNMTIEDPAVDFASVSAAYGKRFLEEVVALYTGIMDDTFYDRIRIRVRAAPLFEAAYAVESGREEYLKGCLKRIEREFCEGATGCYW